MYYRPGEVVSRQASVNWSHYKNINLDGPGNTYQMLDSEVPFCLSFTVFLIVGGLFLLFLFFILLSAFLWQG